MQLKKSWAIQSLLSCLVLNSILLSLFFIMAKQILTALRQWGAPFLAAGNSSLPADAYSAFTSLSQFIGEAEQYLGAVVFGLGLLVTLVLWLLLMYLGGRLLSRAQEESAANTPALSRIAAEEMRATGHPQKIRPEVQQLPHASPQSAVQILAILQREGRLVDFLGEDLRPYTDDQIGAAVRSIHQNCQAALREHLDLKPIFEELEGAEVTVPPDFDPNAIRLTGNVSGDPPFKGTLRHHGWQIIRIDLPQVTAPPREEGWILAPAEVEMAE